MRTTILFRRLLAGAIVVSCMPALAISSKLTYQGHLTDNTLSGPVTGSYDLVFTLQDVGGAVVGTPISFDNASVVAGVFTVELDFGATAFSGADRFLQIGVRRGVETGAFTALTPRSAVTPTPYAQVADSAEFAVTVANDSIGSAQIVNGSVGSADIDASLQRRVSGSCASGTAIATVAANGTVTCESGLQGPIGATGPTGPQGPAGSADAWGRLGNAGTSPATNFIGTTDAQPVVVRSNNQPVAWFDSVPIAIGYSANVQLGGPDNAITPGVRGATISGGGTPFGDSDLAVYGEGPNQVTDAYGSVGGGLGNRAGNNSGTTNDAFSATVGGGTGNRASSEHATVGGGFTNKASGPESTVAGGRVNTASSEYSAVGGGVVNDATGLSSTVGGGRYNTARGPYSTVSGGNRNCAGGDLSWAGGHRAKVRVPSTYQYTAGCEFVSNADDANGDEGTYVWADSQDSDFTSTGPNQFNVRASGGVRLNDDTTLNFLGSDYSEKIKLTEELPYGLGIQAGTMYFRTNARFAWFDGGVHSDTSVDPGAGGTLLMTLGTTSGTPTGTARAAAFTVVSDRNAKTAFKAVNPVDVLARVLTLPLTEWQYKHTPEHRHLGPMAQDFRAAFGLGSDDKSIFTVDSDGVALAAIQGLNAKLEAENAAQDAELAALKRELASLRKLLTTKGQ